jgi:hypothetical protein
MKLIDIENLTFEQFNFGDDENPKLVDYISAKELHDAPEVDPVKHAAWIMEAKPDTYTGSGKTHITSRCSNCNTLGHVDMPPTDLWEMGYKDTYNPKRDKFCRECGYKMDLPDVKKY